MRALLVVVLLALISVPSAQARTITLNWVERTGSDYGYQPMTFKVKSVMLGKNAWSVRATLVNRSLYTYKIVPPVVNDTPSHYAFSLLWDSDCPPPANSCRLEELRATSFKPSLNTLGRGRTWTGTFGGPGLPPRGKLIYVGFGYFFASAKVRFDWVTQHGFKR